ncbi:MAG: hypothetical protein IPH52_25360 [Leptospiraceae bacterium]|nr:hypothetical protein [Leptospiraceae bacterium]MBK7058314.1 hypothetical protein [Leptospiraceae bacterium]
MRRFYLSISFTITCLSAGWLFSQEGEFVEMKMHDFMEDHVELAEKKFKKGDKEPLKKMLEAMPSFAIPEDKEVWEKITSDALSSGKYLSSCKACHSKFKKSYKKSYKKRLISIPKDILINK